jgi:DNA-binding transcriptional regulator YdaS (Cro superfamily)
MDKKYQIALLKACCIVGGQKQLAEKINIKPCRLNRWLNRNRGPIPLQYAREIERATSGRVTCDELIPSYEVAEGCKKKNKTRDT